jgi:hypothetical protein
VPGFDTVTGVSAARLDGVVEVGASGERPQAPRRVNRTSALLMVEVSAMHRDIV